MVVSRTTVSNFDINFVAIIKSVHKYFKVLSHSKIKDISYIMENSANKINEEFAFL